MDNKISACLVLYNEEKVIERCLESIKSLVDEIIVVHDGACGDRTLEIVKRYTNKIFVKEHVGEAEPHRAFAFRQAAHEWILQIDGDEFLETKDHDFIKNEVKTAEADAFILKWELWDGVKPLYIEGLQKMCIYRRKKFHFIGIPHEIGRVDGNVKKLDIFLRHRPSYNNISWKSSWKKTKKWTPVHAKYFFPESAKYECFNETPDKWIAYATNFREKILWNIIIIPFKNMLGQLKNGLYKSPLGISLVLQQYVYYFFLSLTVWKMQRKGLQ